MKKTQEQLTAEINAYITKTSKHLFSVDNKYFTFVPFKDGSQDAYATIIISNDKISITTQLMLSDYTYNTYGNNSLNVRKNWCFPQYQKALSIPYFKKMKALVAEITPQLTLSSDKNKELSEKCSVLIADLVSK
jgi:hypothetical protein